jgi:hypothetical protein
MRLLSTAAAMLLATTAAAHADGPNQFLSAGGVIVSPPPYVEHGALGPSVEVGVQFTRWLWVHALFEGGPAGEGNGWLFMAHGGVEARACGAKGELCAFGDLDLGWYHDTYTDTEEGFSDSINALVAVPRLGFEFGAPRLRLRFGFELDLALASSEMGGGPGLIGQAVTFGLAFRL